MGNENIVIAGVGGVLVAKRARDEGLGATLMGRAAQSMRAHGGIAFGYLGCREDVAPFYQACGWHRVAARERSLGRDGKPVVNPPGQPLLVLPVGSPITAWPNGDVDLRGRAW